MPPARPYAIAHRGASAYAPENTLAAFRKASELGADMWEIDIRVTTDDHVIVFHDATLADGRQIADLSYRQVLDALPDCPLLGDVVALADELGAGLYADIKDLRACLPVLEALKSHEIAPVILGAFDNQAVEILRGADCPYPISALVALGADPFEHAAHADVIHLCWEHMERPQDTLTPDLFARAFAAGQEVAIWHEEDPDRMAAIRTKPVIGICSDRPELVNPYAAPRAWPVEIVCHRGANSIAPENTLPALECALAAGFSHIEVDLQITSDGEIVIHHDPTLERTTSGKGAVATHSLAELRTLDAGSWFDPFFAGTQIPTLAEVLTLVQKYHAQAYLELKSAPPQPVWEAVSQCGLTEHCFFWSFNHAALKELRALAPSAQIMARRQDYPDLSAAMSDYGASIIEFLPDDDPAEIVALRGGQTRAMVHYAGREASVFDQLIALRPQLLNLDHPFDFARRMTAMQ